MTLFVDLNEIQGQSSGWMEMNKRAISQTENTTRGRQKGTIIVGSYLERMCKQRRNFALDVTKRALFT